MSDRLQTDAGVARPPEIAVAYPPLPAWLAGGLLRPGEEITWVCGPRLNPPWERYVTHPGLFVIALALGAACLGVGRLMAGTWSGMPLLPALAAGGIVVGSVFVLAASSGYFTRLVVTNSRLVILQGYEVCRSWGMNDLPRSLVRYGRPGWAGAGDGRDSRTVDLDALKTLLGGSSDKFAESKTILAFGKSLDRIKGREDGRP